MTVSMEAKYKEDSNGREKSVWKKQEDGPHGKVYFNICSY
jgi:hypothetical protein